jgi:quercetin dioxygenase-like cupin family protein
MDAMHSFTVSDEIARLRRTCARRCRWHGASTLIKNKDLRVVLIVMSSPSVMRAHRLRESTAIQVLEGAFRLQLDGKMSRARTGTLVTFERGVVHEVEALEDGAFLLYLPWSNHFDVRSDQQDSGSDGIDDVLIATMPASDPPSWTSMHAGAPDRGHAPPSSER